MITTTTTTTTAIITATVFKAEDITYDGRQLHIFILETKYLVYKRIFELKGVSYLTGSVNKKISICDGTWQSILIHLGRRKATVIVET
jgi:hypothetical protein